MTIVLSADGFFDRRDDPETDDCCPRPLCEIDLCALACTFIGLLPTGPMWDRLKSEAYLRAQETDCSTSPGALINCDEQDLICTSMVHYATYLSRVFFDVLINILWPALREANPETAVTTLDSWLDRYEWQDCYLTPCRDPRLGSLTPYEVPGVCGPVYCPPDVPDELECAVKRGIVLSLRRLRMGGIKNLAWINWVIEPLGAVVRRTTASQVVGGQVVECSGDQCETPAFEIRHIDGMIDACPPMHCTTRAPDRILAYVDQNPCDFPAGSVQRIYPGVLAAECIVRSAMPSKAIITRAPCDEIMALVFAIDGELHFGAVDDSVDPLNILAASIKEIF